MKNRMKILPQRAARAVDAWCLAEAEVGARILDYLLLGFRGALLATAPPTMEETISFRNGSSRLGGEAVSVLRNRSAVLRANPGIRVVIGGFSSESSFTAFAMGLALRRVQAIRAFVLAQGIEPARIDIAIRGAGWSLAERPRRPGEEDPAGRCLLQIADPQWALWRN